MMITGNGIAVYRLLAGRSVIRLAVKGLKGRNTAAWARQLRKDLDLPPRASYAAILEKLDLMIEATAATLRSGEVQS